MLTVDEMEHLIATWIVVWQKRKLGEYAPSWDPGGAHSPNSLFAASFAQAGFAMEIPSPELFYELLPAHYVSIDARRGVKIRGLWYDDEKVLRDYRGQRSARGGKHKGRWVIRRDPRDRRAVFFQDPLTHAWHPLAWTGLPAVGQMPAFGDARVRDLLKKAGACGMRPRSDTELLPVLLELIGSRIPVSQWPTQLSRSQRTEHAREVTQARSAESDRPAATPPGVAREQATVTALQCRSGPRRPRTASTPSDAAGGRPPPPPSGSRPLSGPVSGNATCSSCPRTMRPGRTMADPPAGDESPIVPFLRTAPPPDRTTWEGWQQWRQIRGAFIPAPRLSPQEYLELSPRRRGLHDLHRTATHVNMRLQETPMSVRVSGLMRGRLQNNAVKFMPGTRDGLMVNGGGFQGKTETACSAAAAFEDLWRAVCKQLLPGQSQVPGTRDVFVPVAYCRLPVRATPKALCKTILDVYGDPHPANLDGLIRSVRDAVRDHSTTALLIDDVTRLRLHRGDDQDTLDLIRELMDLNVAFLDHLAGIEDQLRLFRSFDGMLTTGEMPEYLFRRTHGIVGLLRRLIEDGCTEAITSGDERLTPELLARTAIRLGNLADLDPEAGEVPEIPEDFQPPRQQKKGSRRPRNTVFDDRRDKPAADG